MGDSEALSLPKAEDRWKCTSSVASDPMLRAVDHPSQAGIAAVEDSEALSLPKAEDRWSWTSSVPSDSVHPVVYCRI